MAKFKWVFVVSLIVMLAALPALTACAKPTVTPTPPKIMYVGGAYATTAPWGGLEVAAVAAAQDYVKYVNETKLLAPWRTEKFPDDVTLELLWADDAFSTEKTVSIYEQFMDKGMLLFRGLGTATALAMLEKTDKDRVAYLTMGATAKIMSPPRTVFTNDPLYTDQLGAIADWFMENWKAAGKTEKPKVAYFTGDDPIGRSIVIPELRAYLENAGYEFVGEQYVPSTPAAPPTTQLLWLKERGVDLALGAGTAFTFETAIKEAHRLDMGPDKLTFGFTLTVSIAYLIRDLGDLANGVVVAGFPPSWEGDAPAVKFALDLQNKYHPDKLYDDPGYLNVGLSPIMVQVEALRLTLANSSVPFDQLKPVEVLEYGFYQIKNLDTGGLVSTPITYGPGDIQGIDKVHIDQIQDGKQVRVGLYPLGQIYAR